MTTARTDGYSMSNDDDMPEWRRLAMERRAAREESEALATGGQSRGPRHMESTGASVDSSLWYQDAIPDVNTEDDLPEAYVASDREVERILSTTPYEQQYSKFGKGDTPIVRGDERNIRCPMPEHPDTHPSASYNVSNGAFNCQSCGAEGDIFMVAAAHYGMNDDSSDLPYIKRKLAGDLSGYAVESFGNHEVLATPLVREAMELEAKKEEDESRLEMEQVQLRLIENEERPTEDAPEDFTEAVPEFEGIVPDPLPTPESTTPSKRADADFPLDQEPPNVDDYSKMLAPGTFLADYFAATSADRYPNDFHFFHGLLAVGYAAGKDVYYVDDPAVYGNLYLCFMSGTGTGKSNSREWLHGVLKEALPWDEIDPTRSGVNRLAEAGSGETLIDAMVGKEIPYPNHKPGEPASTKGRVKGFVDLDELGGFLRKASSNTSTLRTVLTSMYSSSYVSTRSRGSGTSIATEPFLSVTANIPPETLRDLMDSGDAASGFLNRFTFVTVSPDKEQRFQNHKVPFDMDAISLKLRELLAWCQVRREILLSPEAANLLEEFYAVEIINSVPLANADADDMLARLELFIKKYLLLFAVNEMKEVIDVPVAEKAIRLYWLSKRNLGIVGVKIKQSATGELEDHILEKVKANFVRSPEPITAGEIKGKKCQVIRKVKQLGLDRKAFEDAMRNLVSNGDLVEIRPDKSDKRVKPKYIPHVD